jgi:hypothetical protein
MEQTPIYVKWSAFLASKLIIDAIIVCEQLFSLIYMFKSCLFSIISVFMILRSNIWHLTYKDKRNSFLLRIEGDNYILFQPYSFC